MIRFPSFEPDRTRYALNASTLVTNAVPVADGWGPLADLVPISAALDAECLGAVYVRTTAGAYRLIAFTADAIYELNTTDYTWTDRTGSTTPACPTGDRWWFVAFGDNLICGNLGTVPQYMAITGGTEFADLTGSPPTTKYAWIAGEYLVLAHTTDNPNRLYTSGIGDATYWTVGQRGADFQDFPDGEEIMGGIGAERGAIIFQRTRIRQMVLPAGDSDYSFATSILNPNRGVVAPLSIAQIGPGQFFYYSSDGFMLGAEGKPIGAERVDRWFNDTLDPAKIAQVRSVADPFRKIVWTQGQDASGTKFLIGYNWQLDRWCYADNNVSEMCVLVTPGESWDGLDDLFASIDEADVPFDSSAFSGGNLRFAAFNTDNELGFFTGTARAATLQTADTELNPGWRTLVDGIRTYTDCTDFTLRAITSNIHGGERTTGAAKSPNSRSGLCHMRSDARIHAFRMEIPAGVDWKHVIGVEPENSRRTGRV